MSVASIIDNLSSPAGKEMLANNKNTLLIALAGYGALAKISCANDYTLLELAGPPQFFPRIFRRQPVSRNRAG
jgi:hypothetical protein